MNTVYAWHIGMSNSGSKRTENTAELSLSWLLMSHVYPYYNSRPSLSSMYEIWLRIDMLMVQVYWPFYPVAT